MKKNANDGEKISLLQRIWLQQLQQEYCEICEGYGVEMCLPVFEISGSEKQLGSWHGDTRTLRLSSHLILHYSWSTTLQVLKHEMAHQLCSELFGGYGKPHGEDFQKACDMLGVIPAFRKSIRLSCETVARVAAGSEFSELGRRFVRKVEKLLALAGSANEHEAALAMQKANELIEKHNIISFEQGWEQNYTNLTIDRKKKKIERYQRHICLILHDFFFVRTVLSQLYDPVRHETYKVIEIFGTVENVAIAEYCYHFLDHHLAFLWSHNRHRFKGSARTEKISYYLGLLKGFYEKLDNNRRDRVRECRVTGGGSLIVAEDKKLVEFVGLTFPRLRRVSSRGAKVYRDTFREGHKEGKNITLARGVTVKSCSHGKLLQ